MYRQVAGQPSAWGTRSRTADTAQHHDKVTVQVLSMCQSHTGPSRSSPLSSSTCTKCQALSMIEACAPCTSACLQETLAAARSFCPTTGPHVSLKHEPSSPAYTHLVWPPCLILSSMCEPGATSLLACHQMCCDTCKASKHSAMMYRIHRTARFSYDKRPGKLSGHMLSGQRQVCQAVRTYACAQVVQFWLVQHQPECCWVIPGDLPAVQAVIYCWHWCFCGGCHQISLLRSQPRVVVPHMLVHLQGTGHLNDQIRSPNLALDPSHLHDSCF